MPTPTQTRPTSSRFLTAHLLSLVVTALACVSAACGTLEGEGDEIVEPGFIPGYAVDCRPEDPKEPLVCIPQANWECPLRGNYFREAACAEALGGTPSEYDGKPEIVKVDPDGVGPAEPTTGIHCDALPEGVIAGPLDSPPCDDCNVCTLQLHGHDKWAVKQGYGWDEFPWCPDSYDSIFEQICSSGESAGTPTTGADDSGGPDDSGIWKCMGSWTVIGTMHETNPPESWTETPMSPFGIPDCVLATDEVDAEGACISLCKAKDEGYSQIAEASDWKIWEHFDCAVLEPFTPIETNDPSECAGGGPMALTDPAPFTANGILKIGETTATSDQLGGLMEFTIDTCPEGQGWCDVSITEIRTDARTVNGVHVGRSGVKAAFTITDLEVRMLQPVLGQWERRTGLVTFPGEDLFATISTGEVTLDGALISHGLDHVLFEVEHAQGKWDGQQLTLELPWRKDGLAMSLQLTSR